MLHAKAIPLLLYSHAAPWVYLLVAISALAVGAQLLLRGGKVPANLLLPPAFFLYSSYHLVGSLKDGFGPFSGFCLAVALGTAIWGRGAIKNVLEAQEIDREMEAFEIELDKAADEAAAKAAEAAEAAAIAEAAAAAAEAAAVEASAADVAAAAEAATAATRAAAAAASEDTEAACEAAALARAFAEAADAAAAKAAAAEAARAAAAAEAAAADQTAAAAAAAAKEAEAAAAGTGKRRQLKLSKSVQAPVLKKVARKPQNSASLKINRKQLKPGLSLLRSTGESENLSSPEQIKKPKRDDSFQEEAAALLDAQGVQVELYDPEDGVMLLQTTPGPKNINLIGALLAPPAGLIPIEAAMKLRPYKGPVILNNVNKTIAAKLAKDLEAKGVNTLTLPIAQTLKPKDMGDIKNLVFNPETLVITTTKGRYEVKWASLFYLEAGDLEHASETVAELFLKQGETSLRMGLLPTVMSFQHLGSEIDESDQKNLLHTCRLLKLRAGQLNSGPSLDSLLKQGLSVSYSDIDALQSEVAGQLQLVNAKKILA